MFEKIILELLKKKVILLRFEFDKINKQWGKIPGVPKDKNQYEIDICALNEKTKEILFGECKWKDNVNPEKVLHELEEKASYIEWNNGKRKEHYVIFAKSFTKKIKNQGKNNCFIDCFNLKDIENYINEYTKELT